LFSHGRHPPGPGTSAKRDSSPAVAAKSNRAPAQRTPIFECAAPPVFVRRAVSVSGQFLRKVSRNGTRNVVDFVVTVNYHRYSSISPQYLYKIPVYFGKPDFVHPAHAADSRRPTQSRFSVVRLHSRLRRECRVGSRGQQLDSRWRTLATVMEPRGKGGSLISPRTWGDGNFNGGPSASWRLGDGGEMEGQVACVFPMVYSNHPAAAGHSHLHRTDG
jgi:hypothetical protein